MCEAGFLYLRGIGTKTSHCMFGTRHSRRCNIERTAVDEQTVPSPTLKGNALNGDSCLALQCVYRLSALPLRRAS